MTSILRSAAVVPRWAEGGRRCPGPDEDAFTLAAEALERLRGEEEAAPSRLWISGDIPKEMGWAFPEVTGRPCEVRSAEPAGGWAAALGAVVRSSGEPEGALLWVGGTGPDDPSPAIALALSLGPGLGVSIDPEPEGSAPRTTPDPRSLPRVLARLGSEIELPDPGGAALRLRAERPIPWLGDWEGTQPAAREIDPVARQRLSAAPRTAVSEGAYVPRARYRENLASRWRFEADRCEACHAITFPIRGKCRDCGERDRLKTFGLPRTGGEVLACTVIGSGGQPTEFDLQVGAAGPYPVVIAEFLPGVRATLQGTDAPPGTIRIGSRVSTAIRRLYPMEGEWRYGRKAVPQLERGPARESPAGSLAVATSGGAGSQGLPIQPS